MKNALIYTRFSPRPNADECKSCENQEGRCLDYCEARKYNVKGTWEDRGITGGTAVRPGLQEVMGELAPGDVLVVDSSDRLARDMLVNLTIRQEIAAAGAAIEYANGTPIGDTPEGKLFQNILAAFSSYERDRIVLRIRLGHKRRRENKQYTGANIPVGWKLDPKNPKLLVRCQLEREAIIRMCRLSSRKWSSGRIADRLDFEFSGLRGERWNDRTIRKLIKKHAYWACPVNGDLSLEPDHP